MKTLGFCQPKDVGQGNHSCPVSTAPNRNRSETEKGEISKFPFSESSSFGLNCLCNGVGNFNYDSSLTRNEGTSLASLDIRVPNYSADAGEKSPTKFQTSSPISPSQKLRKRPSLECLVARLHYRADDVRKGCKTVKDEDIGSLNLGCIKVAQDTANFNILEESKSNHHLVNTSSSPLSKIEDIPLFEENSKTIAVCKENEVSFRLAPQSSVGAAIKDNANPFCSNKADILDCNSSLLNIVTNSSLIETDAPNNKVLNILAIPTGSLKGTRPTDEDTVSLYNLELKSPSDNEGSRKTVAIEVIDECMCIINKVTDTEYKKTSLESVGPILSSSNTPLFDDSPSDTSGSEMMVKISDAVAAIISQGPEEKMPQALAHPNDLNCRKTPSLLASDLGWHSYPPFINGIEESVSCPKRNVARSGDEVLESRNDNNILVHVSNSMKSNIERSHGNWNSYIDQGECSAMKVLHLGNSDNSKYISILNNSSEKSCCLVDCNNADETQKYCVHSLIPDDIYDKYNFLDKIILPESGECCICKIFINEDLRIHCSEKHCCISFIPAPLSEPYIHHMKERIGDALIPFSDLLYGNPLYVCRACGCILKSVNDVRLHINVHKNVYMVQKPSTACACTSLLYLYPECKWRALLLQSEYSCSFCYYRFSCKNGLYYHLKICHFHKGYCGICSAELRHNEQFEVLKHNKSHGNDFEGILGHLGNADDLARDQTYFSWNALCNYLNYLDGKNFRLRTYNNLNGRGCDRTDIVLPLKVDPEFAVSPEKIFISPASDMMKYLKGKLVTKLTGTDLDVYASMSFDLPVQFLILKKFSPKRGRKRINMLSLNKLKQQKTHHLLTSNLDLRRIHISRRKTLNPVEDEEDILHPSNIRRSLRLKREKLLKRRKSKTRKTDDEVTLLSRTRSGMKEKETEDDGPYQEKSAIVPPTNVPANEITGEWVGAHTFVCCSCGSVFLDLAGIMDHKWEAHPGVWCAHTMIRGQDAVPPLFCKQYQPLVPPSASISDKKICQPKKPNQLLCTKCRSTFTTFNLFHLHLVDCGGLNELVPAKKKNKKGFSRYKRRKGQGIPSQRYANNFATQTPHKLDPSSSIASTPSHAIQLPDEIHSSIKKKLDTEATEQKTFKKNLRTFFLKSTKPKGFLKRKKGTLKMKLRTKIVPTDQVTSKVGRCRKVLRSRNSAKGDALVGNSGLITKNKEVAIKKIKERRKDSVDATESEMFRSAVVLNEAAPGKVVGTQTFFDPIDLEMKINIKINKPQKSKLCTLKPKIGKRNSLIKVENSRPIVDKKRDMPHNLAADVARDIPNNLAADVPTPTELRIAKTTQREAAEISEKPPRKLVVRKSKKDQERKKHFRETRKKVVDELKVVTRLPLSGPKVVDSPPPVRMKRKQFMPLSSFHDDSKDDFDIEPEVIGNFRRRERFVGRLGLRNRQAGVPNRYSLRPPPLKIRRLERDGTPLGSASKVTRVPNFEDSFSDDDIEPIIPTTKKFRRYNIGDDDEDDIVEVAVTTKTSRKSVPEHHLVKNSDECQKDFANSLISKTKSTPKRINDFLDFCHVASKKVKDLTVGCHTSNSGASECIGEESDDPKEDLKIESSPVRKFSRLKRNWQNKKVIAKMPKFEIKRKQFHTEEEWSANSSRKSNEFPLTRNKRKNSKTLQRVPSDSTSDSYLTRIEITKNVDSKRKRVECALTTSKRKKSKVLKTVILNSDSSSDSDLMVIDSSGITEDVVSKRKKDECQLARSNRRKSNTPNEASSNSGLARNESSEIAGAVGSRRKKDEYPSTTSKRRKSEPLKAPNVDSSSDSYRTRIESSEKIAGTKRFTKRKKSKTLEIVPLNAESSSDSHLTRIESSGIIGDADSKRKKEGYLLTTNKRKHSKISKVVPASDFSQTRIKSPEIIGDVDSSMKKEECPLTINKMKKIKMTNLLPPNIDSSSDSDRTRTESTKIIGDVDSIRQKAICLTTNKKKSKTSRTLPLDFDSSSDSDQSRIESSKKIEDIDEDPMIVKRPVLNRVFKQAVRSKPLEERRFLKRKRLKNSFLAEANLKEGMTGVAEGVLSEETDYKGSVTRKTSLPGLLKKELKMKDKRKYVFKKDKRCILSHSENDLRILSFRSLDMKCQSRINQEVAQDHELRSKAVEFPKSNTPSPRKRGRRKSSKDLVKDLNPYFCADCGLSFASSLSQEDHRLDCRTIALEMSLMTEEQVFECPYCHLTFSLKSTQRRHSNACRAKNRKTSKYRKSRVINPRSSTAVTKDRQSSTPHEVPESVDLPANPPQQIKNIASNLLSLCNERQDHTAICSLMYIYKLSTYDLRCLLTASLSIHSSTALQIAHPHLTSKSPKHSNFKMLDIILKHPSCSHLPSVFKTYLDKYSPVKPPAPIESSQNNGVSSQPSIQICIPITRPDLLKSLSNVEEILREVDGIQNLLKKRQMLLAMKETFEADTGS